MYTGWCTLEGGPCLWHQMLFLYRSGPCSHRFSPVDDFGEIVKAIEMCPCSLYFSSSLPKLPQFAGVSEFISRRRLAFLLLVFVGESEDKADAAFISKRTNEIPGNAGPSRPLLSHTTFGLMYCTCLAFPLAARSLRPLSFPRSFSSAAAVGVPGARSRRCLHRLWAGSKIPLPGDGLCTILRHHLLRHAHHLGASG